MEKLSSKSLMLGDWVLCDGEPYQIAEISAGLLCIDAERELFANPEDLEPIPLTPEILEKNGFKIVHGFGYSESYPTYGWGYRKGLRDYASVDITFYDEPIGGVSRLVRMETASKKDDGINSIHSCDIEFVHQLQHALRLCGIEKEIVL